MFNWLNKFVMPQSSPTATNTQSTSGQNSPLEKQTSSLMENCQARVIGWNIGTLDFEANIRWILTHSPHGKSILFAEKQWAHRPSPVNLSVLTPSHSTNDKRFLSQESDCCPQVFGTPISPLDFAISRCGFLHPEGH